MIARSLFAALVLLAGLAAAEESPIAARAGSDSISVAEVQLELRKALPQRELADDERQVLEAQTLGLLVNRQLILQYLDRLQQGASKQQIDDQLARISAQLDRRGLTLDDRLQEIGLTAAEFRRAIAWEIAWPKYLQSKMTPENVQKYFDQHRREFDGTQLRVAHILLKIDKPDDPASVQKAVDRAGDLRKEILAGKLTFAEAAKKHSQAPTAASGGGIGLISRHEPMPAAFNEAAYELEAGQTSEPVLTSFGVHLIHCLEIAPGKRTLQDDGVEQAVREELIRYLFLWVSEKQRTDTQVEFTGALPYFDPATGKLVPRR